MEIWTEAIKILIFGFSLGLFVLGSLSVSIIITRILIEKFADDSQRDDC